MKAVARPAKKALPRKAKPVLDKAAAARPAEKPRLAPWAAIDPGRAGEQENVAPNDAPMPGVHHEVPAAEGNTTLGVKFSTNNDPNYGPATTSGLINSYNNVTTGSPDPGTSVQPGVKFKF